MIIFEFKIEVYEYDLEEDSSQVDRYMDCTYPECRLFLQVTSRYNELTQLVIWKNKNRKQ